MTSTPDTPVQEPPVPATRRLRAWLLAAVGAGFTALITSGISGAWPWAVETVGDLRHDPPIKVSAETGIWPNDVLAFEDRISRGGDDYALLVSGATAAELNELFLRRPPYKVGKAVVTVTVQGKRSKPVRILDVRPHILSGHPRPSGTCMVYPPPQGEVVPQVVDVDLDYLKPAVGRGRFLKKIVDLAQEERFTVDLTVGATKAAYDWDVEVVYDYGDNEGLQHAFARQPNGEPFRITGAVKRYGVAFAKPDVVSTAFRSIRKKSSCT